MSRLHDDATAAGLQRDWRDANGRPQRVDDTVLEAILTRLDTNPPATPFLSAEAGAPLKLPAGAYDLVLEDGTTAQLSRVDGHLRAPDIIGYHQLTIAGRPTTLAVAPLRCPQPPGNGWGVAVQIPSLRGAADTAYGDFGTLAETAAAFGRVGCSALAISPTHALFPADPSRFSPYSPSTRLFHNVLLADPTLIGAPQPPAPSPDLIDWQHAIPARLAHLRTVFDAAGEAIHTALAAYRAEGGAPLEAHARFDAFDAALGGGGWRAWPTMYRDPASAAVQRFATEHSENITFYAFLQWLADESLAAAQRTARATMPIGLVADLAVGMDLSGSHGWSRRDELLTGLTIGAPPDPLGPDGQNWGITALDPFALARTGFAAFIETIRTALAHAGGIRIDHALGLDRLWVVPEGARASDGAYLTMPGEHLKRIVAIEAHRAGAIVIAEDLGTVPPGFRDDLATRGMLGMRVLLFERDDAGDFVPPKRWRRGAVAMTGTHDTPTMAGWWNGRDITWGRRLGRAGMDMAAEQRVVEKASLWKAIDGEGAPPAEPPLDAILSAVADAPVPLAIIPLEDLLGLEEQPNIPGTIDEHPNWRRRMPQASAKLLENPETLQKSIRLTARSPA